MKEVQMMNGEKTVGSMGNSNWEEVMADMIERSKENEEKVESGDLMTFQK